MSAPEAMYVPDPGKVVMHIRDTLLGDSAREFADVIFRTPDGEEIPACKALLAMRSDYFKRLFFSSFAERGATSVFVAISSKLLREVIEFAYTGDSTLVSSIRAFIQNGLLRRRATPDAYRTHISGLVDLGVTADYCDMSELHRWCKETLRCFVRAVPKTVCLLLERIETQAVATDIVSRTRLIRSIARSPTDCLLVPDVADANPFKWRTSRIEESPESSPEHAAEDFGVLQLSSRTLEFLIQQLMETSGEPHANIQHEYLFQVIYFWATNGRAVQKGDEAYATPNETDIDRWEHAKKLVGGLDVKAMKPLFVRDYVDGSGLAERETLLQAYRYHATKDWDGKAGKIAIKDDRVTITEPDTNKVLKMRRRFALLSEDDRVTITEHDANKGLKIRRRLALLSGLPDSSETRNRVAYRAPRERS